jgi:hypothetical protein
MIYYRWQCAGCGYTEERPVPSRIPDCPQCSWPAWGVYFPMLRRSTCYRFDCGGYLLRITEEDLV